MKRFAYACLGVLALALAFHLGAETARGGATGPFVGIAGAGEVFIAITADGEWWTRNPQTGVWWRGGVIGGGSAVEPTTWGQIKHRAGQ